MRFVALPSVLAVTLFVAASPAVLAPPLHPSAQEPVSHASGLDVLAFDGLPGGTLVSEAFGRFGSGPIAVRGVNPDLGSVNAAVIFDSDAPTGGDPDLGSPNEDFGGPGVGNGGAQGSPHQNDRRLKRTLIVAENLADKDGDGLVDDPDDAAVSGSRLDLDFSAIGTVTALSMDILDIEADRSEATVELLDDAGATLASFNLPFLGDNGLARFDFGGVAGVASMVITLNGSGSVDNVVFDTGPSGGTGRIGDFVWNDENGDGLQDSEEPGLVGVELTLKDAAGAVLEETTSDAEGFYEFTGLSAGDYTIEVSESSVPEGFFPSPCNVGQNDEIDNDCSPAQVTLPSDDSVDDTIDFGYTNPCKGVIGNFIWLDEDGDHVQGPQESGIPGVGLFLRDDMGALVGNTTTNASGFYEFTELCEGTYFVDIDEETIPAGLEIVLCDVGEDDTAESECQPVEVVLDRDSTVDITIDFGFVRCEECSGGTTGLTLRYLGDRAARIAVKNERDKSEIFFKDRLDPNDTFTFFSERLKYKFPKDLLLCIDGRKDATLHTSCSQPIGPGMIVGSFLIEAVDSKRNGIVCRPSSIVCHSGVPASLAMRYTGAGCDLDRRRQPPGLLSCFGDPQLAEAVHVSAYDRDNVWFDGPVELGEVFIIDAAFAGRRRLSGATWVDVYDARSGQLLQAVRLHTSCAESLLVGDRFGSLLLEGFANDQ